MLKLKALKAAQAVMETVLCGVSGRGIVDRLKKNRSRIETLFLPQHPGDVLVTARLDCRLLEIGGDLRLHRADRAGAR